jgi:hypothetical protein
MSRNEELHIDWDDAAVRTWATNGNESRAAMDRFAARIVVTMKSLAPVSPVQAVYAYPVPLGHSTGPPHRGRPIARPGGAEASLTRYPGDLPLRPSGFLRSSIHAFRLPDGSIIIGPTADYAEYVNNGTPPHDIYSTGPWPLRNRASGQIFGQHVRHPGTKATHFIERSAEAVGGTIRI